MPIEIGQLRYEAMDAEMMSFTKAAQMLNIKQSSASTLFELI